MTSRSPDATCANAIPGQWVALTDPTEERHRAEEDERFELRIKPDEVRFLLGGRTPERSKIWEEYRQREYVAATTLWDFNEIVDWIRLYAISGNIRAYLFF